MNPTSSVVVQLCVLYPSLVVVADHAKSLAEPGLILAPTVSAVQVITLSTTLTVQFVGGTPAATTVKLPSTVHTTLFILSVLKLLFETVSVKAVLVLVVVWGGELE